jgi:hypothetical protein
MFPRVPIESIPNKSNKDPNNSGDIKQVFPAKSYDDPSKNWSQEG